MTDWVYDDDFDKLTTISGWISVVATAGLVFLLVSWAVLPVKQTSRHYLSISLAISILFFNVSFPSNSENISKPLDPDESDG